jgi:hypothetical protein
VGASIVPPPRWMAPMTTAQSDLGRILANGRKRRIAPVPTTAGKFSRRRLLRVYVSSIWWESILATLTAAPTTSRGTLFPSRSTWAYGPRSALRGLLSGKHMSTNRAGGQPGLPASREGGDFKLSQHPDLHQLDGRDLPDCRSLRPCKPGARLDLTVNHRRDAGARPFAMGE